MDDPAVLDVTEVSSPCQAQVLSPTCTNQVFPTPTRTSIGRLQHVYKIILHWCGKFLGRRCLPDFSQLRSIAGCVQLYAGFVS